jgi:hypothetical protein
MSLQTIRGGTTRGTIWTHSFAGNRDLGWCLRGDRAGDRGPGASRTDLLGHPLISNNQATNPAQIQDPNLVNPWGVSFGPATPLWVSNEGTGVASLYSITATDQVSIVSNPGLFPVKFQGGEVTGQAFNPSSTAFNGDPFVFVTLGGLVEGWRPGLTHHND